MGTFYITYEQAKKRHSEQVEEIIHKLRSGKSKHKNIDPCELKWKYRTTVRFQSTFLADVFNGRRVKEAPLRDRVSVLLDASKQHWGCNLLLSDVPPEVAQWVLDKEKEDATPKTNATDSPKEIDELLKELSKYPGFIMANVSKK